MGITKSLQEVPLTLKSVRLKGRVSKGLNRVNRILAKPKMNENMEELERGEQQLHYKIPCM